MPQPPEPPTGSFRYRDARALGLSRRRLRSWDIERPFHGVYRSAWALASHPIVSRCESLSLVMGEDHLFSHETAAILHGMPLPYEYDADAPVHVIAVAGVAPLRRPGVVGWETGSEALAQTRAQGLPTVAPADAWAQLAVPGATGRYDDGGRRRLGHAALVAAGDFLLTGPFVPEGRRVPLCTFEDLAAATRRRSRRRGAKALVSALERIRSGAHSPKETQLRLGLVDHGLPEPVTQFAVQTAAGIQHADLGYPEAGLLLEYLGDHHRTDRSQWLADITRRQLFEDAGFRVIEAAAADLAPDIGPLVARVRRALRVGPPRDFTNGARHAAGA